VTPAGVVARRVGGDEPWSFQTTRPVQAVVIGCSISAYPRGSWGDFLAAACPGMEVVNLSKVSLGGLGLRNRFQERVLKNPAVGRAPAGIERWVLFLGGVNSVGTPGSTIRYLRQLFGLAHEHGYKVLGLTLTPWGSEKNKRYWRGLKGLEMLRCTKQVADFILGRAPAKVPAAELPDASVSLLDSVLRDRQAELRDPAPLLREIRADAALQKRWGRLAPAERARQESLLLEQAREVPRWYLADGYHGFDPIHPNQEGHRTIATLACPQLPAAAGCDCARIPRLRWDAAARGLVAD